MEFHSHKVNETRTRSLVKAIAGRIVEISVGTLVFGTILTVFFPQMSNPYLTGLSFNLIEETLCFLVTYCSERVWNKINWGRKVIDLVDN